MSFDNALPMFGAALVGVLVYVMFEAIMGMRKHPMVGKGEADDWERMEGSRLFWAARRHYRDSARIELVENVEGDESYVRVDPTPHEDEDTDHVAFAFENNKTGDVRFFKGKRYRDWATRDDVPTVDTPDAVLNHVVSIFLALVCAVATYVMLSFG